MVLLQRWRPGGSLSSPILLNLPRKAGDPCYSPSADASHASVERSQRINPREKWRQPLHTASTLRVLQLGTLCDRSSVHQPSVRQLRMNTQAGTYVNSSDWDLRSIRRTTNTAVDIYHPSVPPMLRRPRRRGITIQSPFPGGACWSACLADIRRCQHKIKTP